MIIFRDFKESDCAEFLKMCREFYSGDAVDHAIPQEYMQATFNEILRQGPYLRGIIFEQDGKIAGYGQLSFTFSNEVGGFVVLIEEIYVQPEYQNGGIGNAYLEWLKKEYGKMAKRFRLEVCAGNSGAIRLYSKKGFEKLTYEQMILDL